MFVKCFVTISINKKYTSRDNHSGKRDCHENAMQVDRLHQAFLKHRKKSAMFVIMAAL